MANEIKYAPMKPGQETQIFDLIVAIFNEFMAPYFSGEGKNEFLRYVDPKSLTERSNPLNIVALQNQKPIGYIELRDQNHVSLLFVAKEFQRKGVGKELIRQSIDLCLQKMPGLQKITANASPKSVPAYKKMGFISEGREQIKNGVRSVPMALNLIDKNNEGQ